MTITIKAVFAFFILNCFLMTTASASDDGFWLGILRNDGLLTPVAYFDGGQWSSPWPADLHGKPLDKAIESVFDIKKDYYANEVTNKNDYIAPISKIPKAWLGASAKVPDLWYFFSSNKQAPKLTANEIRLHDSHCSSLWSLVTNYEDKKNVDYWPKPKAGFLTSKPQAPIRMNVHDGKSTDALEFVDLLKPRLRLIEKNKIDKLYGNNSNSIYRKHPLTSTERDSSPFEISRMYKSSQAISGEFLYYISLIRKYAAPRTHQDYQCEAITSYNVWLSKNEKNITTLSTEVDLSDCDMKEVLTAVPRLVFPLNNKYYLVSEKYGYEWEYYTIDLLESGSFKQIINMDGGGC